MADIPTTLQQQWDRDIAALGAPGLAADRVLTDIVARHRETHRRYHTQRHLAALFGLLDRHAAHIPPGSPSRLAVWWHDLVYDPKSPDNEQNSADIARQRLASLGAPSPVIEETVRLILMTKDHFEGASAGEGDYFLDADIAILGAAPDVYDQYVTDIRYEYAFAAEDSWRTSRSAFLAKALARPRLFRTDAFESAYADQAHANMHRELATLS